MKAFISHSSKDKKKYVDKVISKFSNDEIFYDKISFQEGQSNDEEMIRGIKESTLFVVFLSNNSLNSDPVQFEIKQALAEFGNSIQKIYPIIIEDGVGYDDPRIPKELLNYNIQLIRKPTVAARRIRQRLRELTWEKMPQLREAHNLFVGRNSLTDELEERLHDYSQARPNILIASGMESIGRRSFLEFVLKKNNIVLQSNVFPTLELSSHESIEDFILKIDDLGLTLYEFDTNMMSMEVSQKIEIAQNLLLEIEKEREVIMVIDDGGIVKADRSISQWFLDIIDGMESLNRVFILLVSNFEPRIDYMYELEYIYSIKVPELSLSDRSKLFSSLCRNSDLNLTQEQMTSFLGVFHGFPDQIFYAVHQLKKGVQKTLREINEIYNYKISSVQNLLSEYERLQDNDGDMKLKIIRVLADFDFIDYDFFYKIFGEDDKNYRALDELIARGVCETIGRNSDYFKLNTNIREIIRRRTIEIDKCYAQKIKEQIRLNLAKLDDDDTDIALSEYLVTVKSALIDEDIDSIDTRYLIPSHYLKTMKELYDVHRKWDRVQVLADKVLENRKYMEEGIIREIEYYLCISLARLKDRRFEKEIREASIRLAEKHFLKALYNRLIGNLKFALENIQEALSIRPNFARAKRELVNVYLSLEDYTSALTYARENYERDVKNNPFHIQAYFTCLIHQDDIENIPLLERLIDELERNQSDKGREMYYRCKAQFMSEIRNDTKYAIELINEALNEALNGSDIYLLIDKFYIALKAGNQAEMNDALERINNKKFHRKSQFYNTSMRLNTLFYAYQKSQKCWEFFGRINNYPNHKLDEFEIKIKSMLA